VKALALSDAVEFAQVFDSNNDIGHGIYLGFEISEKAQKSLITQIKGH